MSIRIPHLHRDPESNWAVDVAKNLEAYLFKICSYTDDHQLLSFNFVQAALLIQASVEVYSWKVEYLYSLVLHVLDFLSHKRQQDETEETSVQPEGSTSNVIVDEESEPFLGLDDIPLEAKNRLEDGYSKGDTSNTSNMFVRPPAYLGVLEGDYFNSVGADGEFESYLLATQDLYRNFILLDPCDKGAIDKFLDNETHREGNIGHTRSSVRSQTRKSSSLTPTMQSGGNAYKSSLDLPGGCDVPENDHHQDGYNDSFPDSTDQSDGEDDPWRPLYPHETGNLKVKPFRKGNNARRQNTSSAKLMALATQFPAATLQGIISPEYKELWETQLCIFERPPDSQSPSLYEKLLRLLDIGGNGSSNDCANFGEDNEGSEDENAIPDSKNADFTMPESTFMDVEPPHQEMQHDGDTHFASNEASEPVDPKSRASLEDYCRLHLDALLEIITEKQTELAARVSAWKQRIESTLKEEDSLRPFDKHEYGERVLDRLSLEGESGSGMSFTDIVKGQEKRDVARTFAALLQLVNDGIVDLDKGESSGQSVCYSVLRSFYVRLLTRLDDGKTCSKKRGKSPMVNIKAKAARTR